MPTHFYVSDEQQCLQDIQRAGRVISLRLACCEAIWELLNATYLIANPLPGASPGIPSARYIVGRHGNTSEDTILFDNIDVIHLPSDVQKAPSKFEEPHAYLFDGDLFLNELSVPHLHPEIAEALTEAIECFKKELFTPCLAMLGKAAEGVWFELGMSLCEAVSNPDDSMVSKTHKELKNPNSSIPKKVNQVRELYNRADLLKDVHVRCRVDREQLSSAADWSDTIRESRNTVHYKVTASTKNTFDKVSCLLISAAKHLGIIYSIAEAANDVKRTRVTTP